MTTRPWVASLPHWAHSFWPNSSPAGITEDLSQLPKAWPLAGAILRVAVCGGVDDDPAVGNLGLGIRLDKVVTANLPR